ncbi:MAG TPA: hypothetical protein VGE98_14850 [Thermoanaerobaculia bacterium]
MKAFTVLGLVLLTAVAAYAAPAPSAAPSPAVAASAPTAPAADRADALASLLAPACSASLAAAPPPALTGSTAITCTHTQCAPCFTHHLRCGIDPVNPSLGCVCLH